MMQSTVEPAQTKGTPRWETRGAWGAALAMLLGVSTSISSAVIGADRTTFLLPLPADAVAKSSPQARYADQALEGASDGWKAYVRLWKAHHEHPDDASIRRFFGLPLDGEMRMDARRGRRSPRFLNWRAGTFAQVETPHFVIYSRAAEQPSRRLAEDLERCYWVWTQMFFPLWEGAPQASAALSSMSAEQPVTDYLDGNSSRITIRRKLQVVLFRDAAEYQQTLSRDVPGIERSTGYYDEPKRTTFLYAAETDDAATRRHEMVHQLFREATRSGLGRATPGEASGFWLVEGIAGYFESLRLGDRVATVGGWDSPRLQYARYRVLAGGDSMPMAELMADGRVAAQQRQDLARWYAHAIAQTHRMLDGGDARLRGWIYQQLAELYQISGQLGDDSPTVADERIVIEAADRSLREFLRVEDQDLIDNPAGVDLRQLCLTGCEVTDQGLRSIPPQPQLQWLDLSRLPISSDAVRRLAPQPELLEQLTLEVTRIDGALLEWLRRADNLREVDLSWTPLGDEAVAALSSANLLGVLWMTGTSVSDDSIDVIGAMRRLESVDFQRSKVTDAGIARLRAARPDLQINPLELRSP